MIQMSAEYLAAGANRHPSAADWDPLSGILAYGADRNIALWRPQVSFSCKVSSLARDYQIFRFLRNGLNTPLCHKKYTDSLSG